MVSKGDGSSKPTLPVPCVPPMARQDVTGAPGDPTVVQPKQRRQKPPPPGSGFQQGSLVWVAGCFVVLAVAVVAVGLAMTLFYTSDRVIPGVRTLGVDLGGQSSTRAVVILQQNWAARQIILVADDRNWTVTPPMLGLMLDANAMVELAHQQGRSLATLESILKPGGVYIPPNWSFAATIAESNLNALKSQVDAPPVDAGLRIVDGRVEATPAIPGRMLDVKATVARLEGSSAQVINEGRLELVMVPVQPAIIDVSAALAKAEQLLANSLSIRAYDPIRDERKIWDVPTVIWGDWLWLGIAQDDPAQLDWKLDTEKVRAFLLEQAGTLGPDRHLDVSEALSAVENAVATQGSSVPVRIYHREGQHIVQHGETLSSIAVDYGLPYPWIQGSNPGIGDTLYAGQVLTIPSPDVLLPLPVVGNKRIVVSVGQQQMWAYEDNTLKWEWPVSTGISSSPTSLGVFQVQSHEPNAYASIWDLWMPHFMGIYRPVPTSDFMNGFHGFPTRDSVNLLWTGDLGHPVTYGCILISSENATVLYEWAEAGVVVEVRP
jgi:LysM repeat protein